ncbi:MAG: SpoIIE family protein phosphatase [Ignavibacteriales bacterium]|nr:SpoIIE family protein phosphatase [Ignavibacteriales bacterium]
MKSKPASKKSSSASDIAPLFEFSNVVNSSLDLKFILGTVLLTVMGKMLVSRGIVLLKRDQDLFEIVNAKGIDQSAIGQTLKIEKPPRGLIQPERLAASQESWGYFFKDHHQKLLVPIVSQKRVVGLLSLGERLGGKKYSKSEKQLIESLVNLSASAIEKAVMIEQLKDVNRSLDRKFQELNTLFDLSKEFNVVMDAERVVRLLTFSLLGQVGVSRYAVCLNNNGTLKVVASRIDKQFDNTGVMQQLCALTNPELIENLIRQKKFKQAAEELQQVGIVAVIPMQVQNQVKGAILLGEKLRGGGYAKADLEFLYSLANLAIISIENARLFREAIEKQKLEDELAIAREIQKGLLPRTLPEIPQFQIAAINISSKQVGGDYYDALKISPDSYAIAIGDVSGKGTPAALLMANVQASLRAFAPMGLSISDATTRINDLTCMNTSQDKFITFFWGALNARTREFCYVNAGHNPPFLLRANGNVERLEEGGIILGLMKTTVPYVESAVTLQSGDVIVMFTDGVSEAMNAHEQDFTEEKLEIVIKPLRTLPPEEIIKQVQVALEEHTRGTPQSDDITMLVLKAL